MSSKDTTTNGDKNGQEEKGDNGSSKRSKTTSVMDEILSSDVIDREEEIKLSYKSSEPFQHAQIVNLFDPSYLLSVKEEIKSQTKVNFKESDLFRVFQSIDLANLQPGTELAQQLPHVMKLRELLYSQEWRSFVERLAGLPPSTLGNQIDCACNCHAPGCHLLCHDDVIGSRKVSYIIYLTEPDWKPEEGGSLEIYGPQLDDDEGGTSTGQDDKKGSTSDPLPIKRLWPTFNSMSFFVVEPGKSFHAVQEVVGSRPRLSLQGWYHASEPPKNIHQATLQQLKTRSTTSGGGKNGTDGSSEQLEITFTKEDESNEEGKENSSNTGTFTEDDRKFLSKYIQEEYLNDKSMDEIQKRFENDSSVQLRHFLLDKWVPKIESTKNSVYDDSYYKQGISQEWKLCGPAHKQRYLEYQHDVSHVDDCQVMGSLLHHVRTKVFESEPMARYLKRLTSLGKPIGIKRGRIRRFRPGLDYTVAHYGLLVERAVLDATMCFVNDDGSEDQDAWQSGDVGGFECYIEATDDDDDDGEQQGAADEYNEDDDTELLSVSASNNTLNLVYRDPGTMRFVKYVGSSAPSSRYDICMEYEVPETTNGEDADNDNGNEDEGNDDDA